VLVLPAASTLSASVASEGGAKAMAVELGVGKMVNRDYLRNYPLQLSVKEIGLMTLIYNYY